MQKQYETITLEELQFAMVAKNGKKEDAVPCLMYVEDQKEFNNLILRRIYINFVGHIKKCKGKLASFKNVNFLLEPLKETQLREGCVLDKETYESCWILRPNKHINDSNDIYVSKQVKDIIKHLLKDNFQRIIIDDEPVVNQVLNMRLWGNLIVPFTEAAIWEALMLRSAYVRLLEVNPYNKMCSRFVFKKYGIEKVLDKSEILKIENSVTIVNDVATIKYTYCNEYEGVVKITHYVYKKGSTIWWDRNSLKEVIKK